MIAIVVEKLSFAFVFNVAMKTDEGKKKKTLIRFDSMANSVYLL